MLRFYACLCIFRCLYLSEALPSCGCVCQGNKLFLHLINPFFNPMGQRNAHNQSCSSDITSLEETLHAFQLNCRSIYRISIIWKDQPSHLMQKQTRSKRITLVGRAKCQPIKPRSPETNTMSSNKACVTACQLIQLLSESSNMKSTNQISASYCCD